MGKDLLDESLDSDEFAFREGDLEREAQRPNSQPEPGAQK